MIPKIIHFIWFGRGEYNARIKDCIDSWHRYLPDYEFKLWNEDSFDIDKSCKFVQANYDVIVGEVSNLIDNVEAYNKMSKAVNPYGDGLACGRIADYLISN